jgi:hypothetical protein
MHDRDAPFTQSQLSHWMQPEVAPLDSIEPVPENAATGAVPSQARTDETSLLRTKVHLTGIGLISGQFVVLSLM